MTVPNSWILCYVREKEELRQEEKVLQFFHKLARHNCYIASTLELGTATIWRRLVAETPIDRGDDDEGAFDRDPGDEEPFASAFKPSVSEQVQQEVRVYVAESQEQLTVEARLMARSKLLRGFEYTITIAPADGVLLLSVDHERFFHRGPAGVMKFRYWVKLLQEIYAYWHPLLMHEFAHQGPPLINPDWETVHMLHLPTLYTLNLFSPELVNKLGREKIAQAAAWMIETLDDQGILLIPTDVYGLTPERSLALDFAAVARHLGFLTQGNIPTQA